VPNSSLKPLYYGNDQFVIFAGSVPEGSKVTFCIPPSFDTVERVLAEADALHPRMPGRALKGFAARAL